MVTNRKKFVATLFAGSAIWWTTLPVAAQQLSANDSVAAGATAETQTEGRASTTAAPSGGVLQEVIVTAQKRAENSQRVPIAISAFNAGTLTDFQVNNTFQLMSLTPGLNITRANTASIPFLRGVGNFTATPGNEAAIATYVDDIYLPSPTASTFDFNSVERIEVLKGPQGTLFGRNAAGGVISITTKDPSFTPSLDAKLGYANYDTLSGSFYGTTPLSDNVAVNLAVMADKQFAGWGKNLIRNEDVYLSNHVAVRSKFLWEPSNTWTVKLIGDYSRTRDDASVTLNIVPGTISVGGYTTPPGFYNVANDTYSYGRQIQYGVSMRVDHTLDWATVSSISSYRRNVGLGLADLDASPAKIVTFNNRPNQKTASQEFQVASLDSSAIKWIGGLYIFNDTAQLDPTIQYNPAFAASYLDSTRVLFDEQKTFSIAPYGQVTVPVYDSTRLTAGLRFTSDHRSIRYSYQWLDGTIFNQGNPPGKTWQKLTWRLAVDHDFSDNVLGYVSYNRGFKSGNYNLNGATSAPVFPEVLDAYEIGMKTELFHRHVRFNWAAFYYDFTNLQVQQSISGGTIQTNAAAAHFKGVDVNITIVPTDNLTVLASAAYVDAKYSKFDNATFNYPCTSSSLPGCSRSINGGGYYRQSGDATGNPIPYAEKLVLSLSSTYSIPIGDADLKLISSIAYHSGFYFDVQKLLRQPRNVMVDASLVYTTPDRRWDVTLWGKNLADEHLYAQEQVNANSANYTPLPPLTFGISVGYHL